MKLVKVKLAFEPENQKPVNFRFGEVNVRIGTKASQIEQQYADKLLKQYPGWIELVTRKPSGKTKVTKEA